MIKAQLIVDDGERCESIELTYNALGAVAAELPDRLAFAQVYDHLSRHTGGAVRRAISRHEFLPVSAIKRLASDPSIGVLEEMLMSSRNRKELSENEVLAICRRDPCLARIVASRIEDFVLDGEKVTAYLETHPDAEIREAMVRNAFAPKQVLRRLAQSDPDAQVRAIAGEIVGL